MVNYAVEMRRLILGRLASSAVSVAADLRIPDLLSSRPHTAEELAARTDTQPLPLRRLLHALVTFGVLREEQDGAFALTPFGETLRSDVPGSAWASAMLAGGEIGQSWDQLLATLRTGKPAFDQSFGMDFFTYLADRPQLRQVFYASQGADIEVTLDQLDVLGFDRYSSIVDIGGGDGALLAHALTKAPSAQGVLFDAPAVVTNAKQRMTAAGLAGRCEIVAGDFFKAVPHNGDLYLMRDILHDWTDDLCLDILATCRQAMPAHATLAIIERATDSQAPTGPHAEMLSLMDLYMMSVLNGQERTLGEFTTLLTKAGFEVRTCHRLSNGTAVIEST
jgi:hypothetical protein